MVLRDNELTMFSEIYIYFVQVYFCWTKFLLKAECLITFNPLGITSLASTQTYRVTIIKKIQFWDVTHLSKINENISYHGNHRAVYPSLLQTTFSWQKKLQWRFSSVVCWGFPNLSFNVCIFWGQRGHAKKWSTC